MEKKTGDKTMNNIVYLFKGGVKMEVIIPCKTVDKAKLIEKRATFISPWEELGEWCSNFAREKNLTMEEAMAILEKVRAGDEGCCRY